MNEGGNAEEIRVCGVMFDHGNGIYGLWEGLHLSEEDEEAIQVILSKYDTDGCSVCGTRKEIAEEMINV